jgi:hypothetical protein
MPITYPTTRLGVKIEIFLVGTGWTDISAYVLYNTRVKCKRGIGIEDTGSGQPNSITLTLDNTDRRFSPRNVTGPYYGRLRQNTKLRYSIDAGTGYVQRAQGEVPNWTPREPVDGARTLQIEAVDVRRRYAKGTPPLNSPLYNSILLVDPVTYMPLEEGTEATRASLSGAGLATGATITSSGTIDFGSDGDLPGSKPAAKLTANSSITVTTGGYGFDGHWQLDWFMKIPSALPGTTIFRRPTSSGTAVRWDCQADATNYRILGYNSANAIIADSGNLAVAGLFIGGWAHFRLMAENTSATQWEWSFTVTPITGAAGSSTGQTGLTGQVGNLLSDRMIPQAGNAGISVAHGAIYDTYSFTGLDDAATGYTGESPTDRFLRLCDEESITASVRSNGTDMVAMGPQRSLDFMSNVRDCLSANEGYLDADTTGNLRMTSRTYLENRAVAMTVSHSSRRAYDIVGADADRLLENYFTASRVNGGSILSAVEDGPYNISDPMDDPDGVGRYPGGETYNLNSDAALADHAGYHTYRGTIDHPALESLKIHFGRPGVSAALLATWLTMDTFQRVQVTTPPTSLGVDTLDQMVFGWTETADQFELVVDMNCRPAAAWTVATVESDERLDSEDHFLLHALTTSDTSSRIYSASTEVQATYWDHRDGNYKVRILGEDSLVTNVSGLNAAAAASFIAAGTGVSASSGSITPGLPAGMQKGDLMLLLASTRNAGTGTVATPSGWSRIEDVDNQTLFGKIHSGSESAPLVTFINGAALEDTLAQMAAFRNVSLFGRAGLAVRVLASSLALNVSAQNVNLPAAISAPRENTLEIYFGWKQDDVTTVGSLGSPPTRIGVVSSTAGNDACQFWDYRLNTDVVSSVIGFWTMTGGASAVSNGAVVVLDANVQIMTLTRAQNGASLTHQAGEQVRVKTPIVLALPEA